MAATVEIDRSLIGQYSEPFSVDIEKGAIRKFAQAIGDDNPLYVNEQAARDAGYDAVLAPATFPASFVPPRDPPWFAPLDRRRLVAGSMAYEYERPITAGMRLTCRILFAGVEDKSGSKGRMELLRQDMEGRDEQGRLVFKAVRHTVYRSLEQVEQGSLA